METTREARRGPRRRGTPGRRPGGSSATVATKEPTPGDAWRRLCEYYADCVDAEARLDELPAWGTASCLLLTSGPETVMTGRGGLGVTREIRALAETALDHGHRLLYGFPVVLSWSTQSSRARECLVGPVLAVELALPERGQPLPPVLHPRDEWVLHRGTAKALGLREDESWLLAQDHPIEPHLGAPSLGSFLSSLLSALGLDPSGLDLEHLSDVPALPGDDEILLVNAAVVLEAEASQIYAGLIRELRLLATKGAEVWNTAAGHLLRALLDPDAKVGSTSRRETALALPLPWNDSQLDAVVDAAEAPLTVVTGPPGTGKSQLVTNVVACQHVRGVPTLVTSTNNGAVDVACARLRGPDLWEGLVVRTGNAEHRAQAQALLARLPHQLPVDRSRLPVGDGRSRTTERRSRWKGGDVATWEADQVARLRTAWRRVEAAREAIDRTADLEADFVSLTDRLADLRPRIPWRLDPEQALAGRPTRGWRRRADRLARARWLRAWRRRRFLRRLGAATADFDLVVAYLRDLEAWQDARQRLEAGPTIDDLWEEYGAAVDAHRATSREVVLALAAARVARGRNRLATVNFRGRRAADDVRHCLPYVPAFATTTLSAERSIPLSPGLFDLVVVDEASQCSIAAVLPLLFRARRALVIGDPKQLRHVCSLPGPQAAELASSREFDPSLLQERGLAYDTCSAYDAFARLVADPHFLAEHYRSHPAIIALANARFYDQRLVVLTDPRERIQLPGRPAVAWVDVRGHVERPPTGSARNPKEARRVADLVAEVIASAPSGTTVGIVTPFSAHASLIDRLLDSRISDEERRRVELRIGTAHRFQGDERDVVVFSPVVSQGMQGKTTAWILRTENLINVALTRARSHLVVVGDKTACRTAGGVLAELVATVDAVAEGRPAPGVVGAAWLEGQLHSGAEAALMTALTDVGLHVRPKDVIAGYECDFVITLDDGRPLVVECDGVTHHDALGRLRRQDRVRDRILRSMGAEVIRVPAWRCLVEADRVAADVAEIVAARRRGQGATRRRTRPRR